MNMTRTVAFGFCLLLVAGAVLAPLWVADPTALNLHAVLQAPGQGFVLGTDSLGRDVLARLVYGARTSLSVGLVAVGLATGLGVLVGALAAYAGRWVDVALMRAADVMLCFPTIFLILAVITLLTPSLLNVMIIIGLTSWMGIARMVRAELLSLKTRPYVEHTRLAGVSAVRVVWKHLLPGALPPILTSAGLGLAGAILTEAGLSFLGLGVQPPTPSWGAMLTEGKGVIEVAWWLTVFPGLMIVLSVLAFSLLAEPVLRRTRAG